MSSKKQFLRITSGNNEGLYQLMPFTGEFHSDELPHCPCCDGQLAAIFDVCQWGFFDDKYRTYAVCRPCLKAYTIDYSIATYELVPRREQKRLGLLLPSKKSRVAGSERK